MKILQSCSLKFGSSMCVSTKRLWFLTHLCKVFSFTNLQKLRVAFLTYHTKARFVQTIEHNSKQLTVYSMQHNAWVSHGALIL